jgi:putative transposase
VTKTSALESLVIASFVRALPVGDAEAAPAEALGDQAAISTSTVSCICGQVKDQYQGWAERRPDEVTVDCLFLDASFFRMHPGSPAEPVLTAWGITTGGKPAFIGLAPGTGESCDAWKGFLADLKERGLASPLLVISDGAAGLTGAVAQVYPKALRQRCLIHRARNVLACMSPPNRRPRGRHHHLSPIAANPGSGLLAMSSLPALPRRRQRPVCPAERPDLHRVRHLGGHADRGSRRRG